MSFSLDLSAIPDGEYDAVLGLEIKPAAAGLQKLHVYYTVKIPSGADQTISAWPMPLDAPLRHPQYAETRHGKSYVKGLTRLTGWTLDSVEKTGDLVELFDGLVLRVRVVNAADADGFRIPRLDKILYVVADTDGEPFTHPDPDLEAKIKAKAGVGSKTREG